MHTQMKGKTNQEILDFFTKYLSLEEFEKTGRLIWLHREGTSSGSRLFNKTHAGKALDETSPTSNGYRRTTIEGVKFYTHHIAYFFKTRELWDEDSEIDHINRNRLDNHPENLRAVSKSANCLNRGSSVQVVKTYERKQDVTDFLTTHGSAETVRLSDIVTHYEDNFMPLVYRPLDRDHVADLKKNITEQTNGKLRHALLGVRVKGDSKVYLADGNHRLTALKEMGLKTAQMRVFQVEDFADVTPAANEIKAVEISLPNKKIEREQAIQTIYARMASDAGFRGGSNAEISRTHRINPRTVARMKRVIEYLRGEGKEPDKWWKDRLILKGDMIEDTPRDVCQEKAAKRVGKALSQNEQILFIKENDHASAVLLSEMGFTSRDVMGIAPIMKGIEDGLITKEMNKFDRIDVAEALIEKTKSDLDRLNQTGLMRLFDDDQTPSQNDPNVIEFAPIKKKKGFAIMG